MIDGVLQTEFPVTLPRGYVDENGDRHREGVMRLATAADEIRPLKDPRVQANREYLPVLILSRVITRLGGLEEVTPHVIESLPVSDFEHLQGLYDRINGRGPERVELDCPECGERFSVELHPDGEVVQG
jgi:hypothetical protein